MTSSSSGTDRLAVVEEISMNKTFIGIFFSIFGLYSGVACAVPSHDDQCAEWLCAPYGFPSGCEQAKHAYDWRRDHHMAPLPPYKSCDENSDGSSGLSYRQGYAAYIREHTECAEWGTQTVYTSMGPKESKTCKSYKTVPGYWKKGQPCIHGSYGPDSNTPKGCTDTKRYLEFIDTDGQVMGEPLYY